MTKTATRPAKKAANAQASKEKPAHQLDATPKPTSAVQFTTNYGIFRSIVSNREVDDAHVRRLMESITKENLLHLRPIDVTEEFGVIDGQHRLEAAERLGLPIYYQTGQLNQRHIAVLNSVSKHWTTMDYLNHFTIEGLPHYKKISDFVSHHAHVPLGAVLRMLSEGSRGNMATFRAGTYEVTRWQGAVQVAEYCKEISRKYPHFRFAYTDSFVKALDFVVRTGHYDHVRMMHKIDLQPRALMRCPSTTEYVKLLEELFNYNAGTAKRVRFQ